MPDEALKKIYLETVYSVFIDNIKSDIIINQPLAAAISQLLEKHQSKAGYVLTAWNPRSQLLSRPENNERNKQLKTDLLELNCMLYDAVGTGSEENWKPEESFFILGADDSQIEFLATRYEQNAYVKVQVNQPATLLFSSIWKE